MTEFFLEGIKAQIAHLIKESKTVLSQLEDPSLHECKKLYSVIDIFNDTIFLGQQVVNYMSDKKNREILSTCIVVLNNNSDLEAISILEKSIKVIEFIDYMCDKVC
jgi:hypothetical protein